MLNKKALAPGVLVGIIAMTIIFLLLFRVDVLIANVITGGVEHELCFLEAGAAHISKAGPNSVFDLNICPMRLVKVMMDSGDIDKEKKKDKEEDVDVDEYIYISKQIPDALREKLAKWYNEPETNFDINKNKDRVLLYRLNEVIAKQLKSCWGDRGRGTFNLFDEDFSNFQYEPGKFKSTDSLYMKLGKALQIWDLRLEDNPKVCKICSNVIFHQEIQDYKAFKGKEIDLKPFLKNNPVKLTTQEALSFWEFLEDDIKLSDYPRPEYTYTVDKTYSVVFMRANLKSYAGKTISRLASLNLKEIFSDRDYKEDGTILAMDFPLLIPLEEVSKSCDKYA